MSEVWLLPGTHGVRFYDAAPAAHAFIADFFTADARDDDLLLFVGRRSTFDGVTALLASGRYGPADATAAIRFVDAEETLAGIMDGDIVDMVRAEAAFVDLLHELRRDHAGGTIRLCGEGSDLLCEQGNHAAALALEHLSNALFAAEPRLTILCPYARDRFHGNGHAVHYPGVCALHTHVAATNAGEPSLAGGEPLVPRTGDGPLSPNVYLIEDDVSIRRSLKRLLALSSFQVRVFESAEAFLADLDGLPRGCLVVDIQLGGMSGLDLLAHMQTARPDWPSIAMSGSDDDHAARTALGLGVRAFLAKPFNPQRLLDAITAVMA